MRSTERLQKGRKEVSQQMIQKIATKNREEWKALRKKYIGGSDAASVVGMNHFRSAYAPWAEKTGLLPGFEGNLATEVGGYLEEFVAKKFEAETAQAAERTAQEAQEAARKAGEARDRAQRALALANPDAAVFAALYGQVQEDWNKLHGAWIKAAAADAATGEKLRTAARALAEKWRKEEW